MSDLNTSASLPLDDAKRFLDQLWQPGDVRELRIPKYNAFKSTASGYFTTPEQLAAAVGAWDRKANVYVTLNPVQDNLVARAHNRVNPRAEYITGDGEAKRRTSFFLDADPDRPSGVSSADTEWEHAKEVFDRACTFLQAEGWPEPLLAMSGNGYYVLYCTSLANDTPSTALVDRLRKGLAARFDTPEAHIDPAVYNASRLIALVGTLKVKGDPTTDRPHRRSHFEQLPAPLEVVSQATLTIHSVCFTHRAVIRNGL